MQDESELVDVDELENEMNEMNRFSFVDESDWDTLVVAKYSAATMKKLQFVENLFGEWARQRNLVRQCESLNLIGILELYMFTKLTLLCLCRFHPRKECF